MRVVAYIPDLLFGSTVVESLRTAGHEPVLVGDSDAVQRELATAQVLIVDLTADAEERIAAIRRNCPAGCGRWPSTRTWRPTFERRQWQAGFDLVVPRSRMAREGVALVERLSAGS